MHALVAINKLRSRFFKNQIVAAYRKYKRSNRKRKNLF